MFTTAAIPRPSVPAPEMPVLLKFKVPPSMVTVPVNRLVPDKVRAPGPAFTRFVRLVTLLLTMAAETVTKPDEYCCRIRS